MARSLIFLFVLLTLFSVVILTYGFLTDWTFVPTRLKTSEELGCLTPSEELFVRFPNALSFKANYDRKFCVPHVCKPGFTATENGCEVVTLTKVEGCFSFKDFIKVGFSDVFYNEDGISSMSVPYSYKNDFYYNFNEKTPEQQVSIIRDNLLGFIKSSISGSPPKRFSDYKYIAFRGNEYYLTNKVPKEESTTCDIETYYEIPELGNSLSYGELLADIAQGKDQEVVGYDLLETNTEFSRTSLKCGGSTIEKSTGLVTLDTCRKICDSDNSCKAFTYYHEPKYTPTQWDDPYPDSYYSVWNTFTDAVGRKSYYRDENCFLHTRAGTPESNPFANCHERK